MKRGGPLTRRGQSRFPHRRLDAYRAWIKALPCDVARQLAEWTKIGGVWALDLLGSLGPCWGPVDPAHVRSRGAGGADVGNCISLCRRHHRLFDQDLGHREFSRRALLDPVARSRHLEQQWRDVLPERPF